MHGCPRLLMLALVVVTASGPSSALADQQVRQVPVQRVARPARSVSGVGTSRAVNFLATTVKTTVKTTGASSTRVARAQELLVRQWNLGRPFEYLDTPALGKRLMDLLWTERGTATLIAREQQAQHEAEAAAKKAAAEAEAARRAAEDRALRIRTD